MESILKNICKVEWIEAGKLKNVDLVFSTGECCAMINYWRNWQPLEISGLAEAVSTSSQERKDRSYTIKLTAALTSHFDTQARNICYLLTAVDGTRYLLGSHERPYPVTTTEDVLPGRETDRSVCNLSVTYKNPFGLLRVIG